MHEVERLRDGHGHEAGDLVALEERLDVRVEGQIRQAIGIVGEEHVVAVEMGLDASQTLADVRVVTSVDEGDLPLVDARAEDLNVLAAVRKHEVICRPLVVLQEELLDPACAVAEAEDEFLVAEVGVVLHQVPKDGPLPDVDQRLRNVLGIVAEA